MVLTAPAPVKSRPLALQDLPVPAPGPGEVLVRVTANAVCRTDLHVVESELPDPTLPLVLGHQIVGRVEQVADDVEELAPGDRVGVPWLGGTDGTCPYCRAGSENLCDAPTFTGYRRDGGYAEFAVARADFALSLPEEYPDSQAAPLLCAGLIGFRAMRLARTPMLDDVERIGLYGFGQSAHIVIQVANDLGSEVYVVTRGAASRAFALELGAKWAGGPDDSPPVALDSAIIFAPVGALVPVALAAVRKGGVVVCAGIHMSPIPEFSYDLMWGERILRSVANLTRADGHDFMRLAGRMSIHTEIEEYPLAEANEALARLKAGDVRGAAVLVP